MAATIWKGQLTFGLVSVPVKLYRAARAEKIHMHNIHRQTGARMRQVLIPEGEREETPQPEPEPAAVGVRTPPAMAAMRSAPIPFPEREPEPKPAATPGKDILRGYEYEKDRYVPFEKEELERLAPAKSSEMQIGEFVRFAEVDPVYLESSYYIAPDRGGEKPYALLFDALKKTGYAAIAEFVMHRRDQTMIVRTGEHGLIGHTLFYSDEVRRGDEFRAENAQVSPREAELAVKLVEALAAPFEPEKFRDKYRERLQSAIDQKLATGQVRETPAPDSPRQVVDIMAALKESLAKVRKPAQSETSANAPKRKRAGHRSA